MSCCSSHLHRVVDVGHDPDDGPYLDRACVPGASLGTLCTAPFPLDVVVAIGEAILEGIRDYCASPLGALTYEAAGAGGVLALVAPCTVFLRADGRVMWAGLSLGTLEGLLDPDGGDVQGLPPEILASPERGVDPKGLMFGLGSVMYRCATGEAPFGEGADLRAVRAVTKDKPVNPQELVPSIPVELARYVMQLLEKDPHGRFEDLDGALAGLRATRDAIKNARPARLAVREWLKEQTLNALKQDDVIRHDDVTAEYHLASLTEEGPADS